jgi:hypothetical protein
LKADAFLPNSYTVGHINEWPTSGVRYLVQKIERRRFELSPRFTKLGVEDTMFDRAETWKVGSVISTDLTA